VGYQGWRISDFQSSALPTELSQLLSFELPQHNIKW
jgi:hypothetical protein